MTEKLLQYIWQFQYYNKGELTVTTGETLQVIVPGQYNTNQGPDFLHARIRIGKTSWAGSIELHLKTSDWTRHKHQADKNYENVILHVVWDDDSAGQEAVAAHLPVLVLKSRVPLVLLQRYRELLNTASFIPCEKMIYSVNPLTWRSWKDRLLAERLLRKTEMANEWLAASHHHWEETFWWMLAKNFGATVNAGVFEEMARSIPVNILAKHKQQIHQLEALLFGQAGLLSDKTGDDYFVLLQKEYRFLKEKYGLKPVCQPVHFLRMRPVNFPTVRLAQLAALVQRSAHLFSSVREIADVKQLRSLLNVTANDYWHYHYRFSERSSYRPKRTGDAMIDNIIINTICPLLFAYGTYHQEQRFKDKSLRWLEETSPEKNSITTGFANLGTENRNAADSQALIELRNEYCKKKRCLECGIGNALLKGR
ncbi:MAG: DUF2851 family protein [Chitinophagaceae bacterium]